MTPEEFDKLLCGNQHIDVYEWRKSTKYRGAYSESHKVIGWFWDCLATFNQEDLRKFL